MCHDTKTSLILAITHYASPCDLLSVPRKLKIISYLLIYLFRPCHKVWGILVPLPGMNPCPRQWNRRVLTTGPLGNSLKFISNSDLCMCSAWYTLPLPLWLSPSFSLSSFFHQFPKSEYMSLLCIIIVLYFSPTFMTLIVI